MHYPEMFWLAVCTWLYRRGLESPNPRVLIVPHARSKL